MAGRKPKAVRLYHLRSKLRKTSNAKVRPNNTKQKVVEWPIGSGEPNHYAKALKAEYGYEIQLTLC